MNVQDYGSYGVYSGGLPEANGKKESQYARRTGAFMGSLNGAQARRTATGAQETCGASQNGDAASEEEKWEEKLRRLDEELEEMRRQNKREQERIQEERARKRRIRRKLWEKEAYKKYLARQDEIEQMNEKIALERMVGEDVYIEKAPLSKSLSVAEIMAICSSLN